MLFDLRGRGRRRTVQAIYLSLAILMGGGLVFFGIGGEVSGGLLDGLGLTGQGGTQTSSAELLERQEKRLLERVRANPRDEAGWAQLTRVRFQQAGQGDNYDQQTGAFTDAGKRELRRAEQAWDRYLALDPRRPNDAVASLMVQAFSPLALNQAAKGVAAAEIVAEARPSSQTYFQLCLYAYEAGQTRKGELAGRKAVELAPKDQRAAVKAQVDQVKKDGGFPSATGE